MILSRQPVALLSKSPGFSRALLCRNKLSTQAQPVPSGPPWPYAWDCHAAFVVVSIFFSMIPILPKLPPNIIW